MRKLFIILLGLVTIVAFAQDFDRRVPGPIDPKPGQGSGSGGATDANQLNYTPANASNWDVVPTKASGALDELSSRTQALEDAPEPTYELNDLTDVDSAAATDGQVLSYDSGTSTWIPATVSSGGIAWSTPVDANIIPDTAGAYTLGSSSFPFGTVFGGFFNMTGLEINDGTNSMTVAINGGDLDVGTNGLNYVVTAAGSISHEGDDFTVTVDKDVGSGVIALNGDAGSTLNVNTENVDFTGVTNFDVTGVTFTGLVDPDKAMNDLSDVNTAGVTDGQVLAFDSGTSTWLPVDAASGGIDWSTPVDANIVPDNNFAYNIGSTTNAFFQTFSGSFYSNASNSGYFIGTPSVTQVRFGCGSSPNRCGVISSNTNPVVVEGDDVRLGSSDSTTEITMRVNNQVKVEVNNTDVTFDQVDVNFASNVGTIAFNNNEVTGLSRFGFEASSSTDAVGTGDQIPYYDYKLSIVKVVGISGNSVAASQCFGAGPFQHGAVVTVIGTNDTDTVQIDNSDTAGGCIVNGTATLGRFKSITFYYDSGFNRWIETTRNF